MEYQRIHRSSSWNPPSQKKSSPFSPRPSTVQAHRDSHRPPTQEETENATLDQNKSGAYGPQLRDKNGTIMPLEQVRLGALQAKMDDFWAQRLQKSPLFDHNFANIPVHAPDPNHTGLPDSLKSGIESLSGISMDNVNVHYNSSRPAQFNALAYAHGTDIHIAPGQERHLPHEAWHIIQQAQGRVRPTMKMSKQGVDPGFSGKDGVLVNDDERLEHEAAVMGARADGGYPSSIGAMQEIPANAHLSCPVQLMLSESDAAKLYAKHQSYGEVDSDLHRQLVERHSSLAEAIDELVKVRGPHPDNPNQENDLTVTTASGRVMINPDILDEALTAPREAPREPVMNEFHQNWQRQRDEPFNREHPNWLPPVPTGLKGRALNRFMEAHEEFYPKVQVSLADELYHFTTDEGASGMNETQMMYPSVVAGMKTTHYGRGVYFTDQGPTELSSKTHGDVTKAIYTSDNPENRKRSKNLASVDVRDMLILKYSLKNKAPVFMHPTTEPVDVSGRLQITPTANLVKPDASHSDLGVDPEKKRKPKPSTPPSSPENSSGSGGASSLEEKKPQPPKLPSVPKKYPHVVDWNKADRDYEEAKRRDANLSFVDFLKKYRPEV